MVQINPMFDSLKPRCVLFVLNFAIENSGKVAVVTIWLFKQVSEVFRSMGGFLLQNKISHRPK